MLHHTDDPVCQACEEKLNTAHQVLKLWFLNNVKTRWPSAHVSWAYRDKASQEQAFADGKSKLHYPDSAHNKTGPDGIPCATALDLFQIISKIAVFDPGWYKEVSLVPLPMGSQYTLFWGAKFKSLGDNDHFEIREVT